MAPTEVLGWAGVGTWVRGAGVGLFKVKKPLEQRQALWTLGTWGLGLPKDGREESSLGGFGVGGLEFLV